MNTSIQEWNKRNETIQTLNDDCQRLEALISSPHYQIHTGGYEHMIAVRGPDAEILRKIFRQQLDDHITSLEELGIDYKPEWE